MNLRLGIYEHYKGGRYRVIANAKLEENLEEMVVYEALKDGSVWVRPLKVFMEEVEIEGKKISRFKYINE